ncbi:MAG: hypothetical protein ACK4PK_09855 [Alphaproteobacteria bacterium]
MTEVTSKIRLKTGNFEIEYEGNITDFKTHLTEILETVSGYLPAAAASTQQAPIGTANNVVPFASGQLEATTNTIASKLGCNNGVDLIKAAALQLTLVQGKSKFTRQELIDEMKTSSYHKSSYISNLTSYLKTLLSNGLLNESQKDTYSVNPSQLQQLQLQVA